jgi:hypothetical protein
VRFFGYKFSFSNKNLTSYILLKKKKKTAYFKDKKKEKRKCTSLFCFWLFYFDALI